jgi:hypothetical protein
MALTTQSRAAHDALRDRVSELRVAAETVPELSPLEREEEIGRLLRFLRERVERHTRLDETVLYPAVTVRLGDPLVAASMNYDHLAIRRWIDDLASADLADTARLQRLLYGLDALIRVHMWKEDELFLAALDSPSWPIR